MTKILGVDEAGRGAVIGPLVICGALIDEKDLPELKKLKVKDSKLLSENQRVTLSGPIRAVLDSFEIIRISNTDIDSKRKSGINLNDIEAEKMGFLINHFKPDVVYIDAIDSDILTFRARLKKYLTFTPQKMILEHEADVKYPIVSAASILAKVERDSDIEALKPQYAEYGDFGSGYPSDPLTKSFLTKWLKKHKSFPPIVRVTWSTAEELQAAGKQKTLSEWLKK